VNPIRVLHVIPALGRAGTPVMLARLVQALGADSGYHHEIVSLRPLDHYPHDLGTLDIPLHSADWNRAAASPAALRRLRHIVRDSGAEIVQGWQYHGNVAAVLAACPGMRVLWGVRHSLHPDQGERPLTRALIRGGPLLARRVERIVYCSEVSAHQHSALGYPAGRSIVIPNGVDTDLYQPSQEGVAARRAALGLPAGTLVGHAGRYHPVKNHHGLIRAFARIAARHPDATLVLAGRDVHASHAPLQNVIETSGIGSRILLLGERSDMPRLLPAFDTYVSSSHSEAFSVSLLEAMSCGVPCVATDVGDSGSVIGDAGRVVPPGNDLALAASLDAILGLAAGDRRDLGTRARIRVLERYSLQRMAASYAEVYAAPVGPKPTETDPGGCSPLSRSPRTGRGVNCLPTC
jgi:glycosyltransferase involved in cell wall biosynthesis